MALLLDARTIFEGHKGRAFSGTSGAGRSETQSEGSLHDLRIRWWQWVQPMLLVTWALLVHVGSMISNPGAVLGLLDVRLGVILRFALCGFGSVCSVGSLLTGRMRFPGFICF